MKYIKVLVIFLSLSLLIGASISGFVRDKHNGEPLPYTNVFLSETTIGTASDVNGYFILPNVPEGTFTMKVMMIGYKTLEETVAVIDFNLRLDFDLEKTGGLS